METGQIQAQEPSPTLSRKVKKTRKKKSTTENVKAYEESKSPAEQADNSSSSRKHKNKTKDSLKCSGDLMEKKSSQKICERESSKESSPSSDHPNHNQKDAGFFSRITKKWKKKQSKEKKCTEDLDADLDAGAKASSSGMTNSKKKKNKKKHNFHKDGQEKTPDQSENTNAPQQNSGDGGITSLMDLNPGDYSHRSGNVGQSECDTGTDDYPVRNDSRQTWSNYGKRPPQQWFNRGRKNNRPFHKSRGRFWKSSWNRPWVDRHQGVDNWFQGPVVNQRPNDYPPFQEQFNPHFFNERDIPHQKYMGPSHHFQLNPMGGPNHGLQDGPGNGENTRRPMNENWGSGSNNYWGDNNSWGPGNGNDNLCPGSRGNDWGSNNFKDSNGVIDRSPETLEGQSAPKRERSISLNLDDQSKSSENDPPLPKKDNSNVSLKAMQIIDQIVNCKKPGKVVGSTRDSQSSSIGSDHESVSSKNQPASSSTSKTAKNIASKIKRVSDDVCRNKGNQMDQWGGSKFEHKSDTGMWRGKEVTEKPLQSPSWQYNYSSLHDGPTPQEKPHFWRDEGHDQSGQNYQYSAPLMDSSSDENPEQLTEKISPHKLRLGSRSLSESHAEDISAELKSSEKHNQVRQGSNFKISLPKASKPLRTGPLNKDYLTKLVNSPRSRKEQIQVAKMLKSRNIKHRPSVQKPSLHLSEQSSEQKQSNVSIDELPDDIRAQISQLIETDMNLSDEEAAQHSSEIIALSSHDEDEDDEDDLDLIMLRDSPSPTPGPSEIKKDKETTSVEPVTQKPKETRKGKPSLSHILIEDSDEEEPKEKLPKSSCTPKRRRNVSESSVTSMMSSSTDKPIVKKPKLQNMQAATRDTEPPNILVIEPKDTKSNVIKIPESVVDNKQVHNLPSRKGEAVDDKKQIQSEGVLVCKADKMQSPSKHSGKISPSPSALVRSRETEEVVDQVMSQNQLSPMSELHEASESPGVDNLSCALCPESRDSVVSAQLERDLPLHETDAADCMDQMLALSLREDEIHNKLSEVHRAVEKLQSLLKKTKDQLQRRLKQRDKLMAEEDELRSQRICLLKGAVEKRATPPKPQGSDTPIPRVAVSEISSSTEAVNELEKAQELPRQPDTQSNNSQEQATSDTLPSSQQNICDKNSTVLSVPSESCDSVIQNLPQVPIKKETIEPDSTSVIQMKEPKTELKEPETMVQIAPQETPKTDDVLNKLRDGKGLKYLGSLNAKDSDFVIKSLASSAGPSNQKIYTLSSSDQLVPLTRNTQSDSCSESPRQVTGTEERFNFNFDIEPVSIKTEMPDESSGVKKKQEESMDWEKIVKEMNQEELAAVGITAIPPNKSKGEDLPGVADSKCLQSEMNPSDNAKKSSKDKKSMRRKQTRSSSVKNSASLSTDKESPRRSPRQKPTSKCRKSRKETSEKASNIAEDECKDDGRPTDIESKGKGECLDAKSLTLPEGEIPLSSDVQSADSPSPEELKGHLNTIHDMVIWENWLITASEDQKIMRFDMNTCKVVKEYVGHSKGVQVIQVYRPSTSDSVPEIFSGSYDNSVITWDLETGDQKDCWAFAHRVHCMDINWNRMYIGLGDGNIICYSLVSRRLTDSFYCSKAAIRSIKTTKEGSRRILVVASSDCSLIIRDAMSGLLMRSLEGHSKVPMCLQVSNPLVYSGGADQTLQVHDLNSGELVKCLVQKRVITSLAIHEDKIYVAGYEEVVRCFDVQTLNLLFVIYGIKKGVITSLRVHGRKLFIGRKNGALECVTLVEKAKYACKFGQCLLPLTSIDDLITHINDYHIMPNQSVIRCLWNDCSQYITKNKDALSHVKDHVSADY